MITIEEPPTREACSTCMKPLTFVYAFHLGRTVAVVPAEGPDRFTFRIHTCEMHPEKTWRHVQRVDPKVTQRGARRARAVLAGKGKTLTEEK